MSDYTDYDNPISHAEFDEMLEASKKGTIQNVRRENGKLVYDIGPHKKLTLWEKIFTVTHTA